MRTVLILAALVALALAGTHPEYHKYNAQVFENVDDVTVQYQYKVMELLETIQQVNTQAEYYKVGYTYDIQANVNDYTKKEVVDKFFQYYTKDFVPRHSVFTIFNHKVRDQVKALYDVFYYAKDLETFYKSAAWARVHINCGMFVYAFYIAMIHRPDTTQLVIPALYEVAPQFYVNNVVYDKMHYSKMIGFKEFPEYGITKDGNHYFYYANYSSHYTYGDEHRLSYFTEDIGWNSYYMYFHMFMPFWEQSEYIFNGSVKERRGEIYYHFYQQLLARYYLERLTNGMGEIPKFSWYQPFETGYRPLVYIGVYPFAQRSDNYVIQNEYNVDDLRFVNSYENIFMSYLEEGQFKSYHKQVDFYNSKSINFVGNFFQCNADLYEKIPYRHYHSSYEMAARRILSGVPQYPTINSYDVMPSALDFYQTSLRDPAFYQIYNKIVGFMLKYKQYLQPYTQENLHYSGVKVNNVEVSRLETYFDFHIFNATNALYWSKDELEHNEHQYLVMQPRLNHQPFNVKINLKSDVEEMATFKIFIGPKYDSYGNVIKIEDNYMNFVELDWFNQRLTKGENVVERSSNDFFFYKEDTPTVSEIYKYLSQKKLPTDMIYNYDNIPNRLMLPRGTNGGYPMQIFVVVYKSVHLPNEYASLKNYLVDDKPFGYPLDRPVSYYFFQPNMYVEDVVVYHSGYEYPISYEAVEHSNQVPKH
ncbi:hypothetical protein ACJJTC_005878 [Scirpophaga incertulas]